ncbi:DUF3747 domain-containing protein [Gloeocapsopsis dulcis]|uniref:S-layer protein n=1 Tax=Gloeocapsopsis dulcis AAB1 = 1H9 TaxID=1433147 RepID=A0A6N8G0M1_9CHRO|nr:DUF3747 domain-containing protein [Gloeocapsopsis dulcis]MUL38948.1 S-layer protein [Gloeocapsopsis dulcis AAB1 = 1H9]WNN89562.1 DUF3747 domain-containing protein [Gloeocapsopsis dulcis]
MKLKRIITTAIQLRVVALAAATLGVIIALTPANTTTFKQEEVEQNKFIAIAAPLGNGARQLLILEQQSDTQACWSESGSNPVVVEPLLLQFDFTGICGRNTDSNGYSIRMANQDLGLYYRLSIIERDGEFVLVGISDRDRQAPPIEIGRTRGIHSGFSKILLEPGWQFTKRTFQGKTLGHVYLSSSLTPPAGIPTSFAFTDIANNVYAKEIQQAVALGFVAGFSQDNTFRPEVALTREQLVSLVLGALSKVPDANLNLPTEIATKPYPDVETTRWSAVKIGWARDNQIISGYADGTFRPTQTVTRAELMAVLRRAAEFAKSTRRLDTALTLKQPTTAFSDTTGHWAAAIISQMSSYCHVASPPNEVGTAFAPDAETHRSYAAAATVRMLDCVKQEF